MNEYAYEDMEVGMRESFKCTVTEEMMDSFRAISGDDNPLHTDAAFARGHGYRGRVAYGMLTMSLFSRLGGYIFREGFA